MRRPAIFLAGVAMLAACNALTGVGDLAIEDQSVPDAAIESAPAPTTTGTVPKPEPDGGGLGSIDASIVDGCSATNCEVLPDGFQLVALGDPTVACPSGFGQPFDGVEGATVDATACTCGCDMGQQPSCTVAAGQTINLNFGPAGGGACPSVGQSLLTGCGTDGFLGPFTAFDRNYVAPQASLSGGTCTGKSVKNDAKLKSTPARVCQATVISQCESKTCLPDVGKYAACVAAKGDQKCPDAWTKRHLVGSSATFACGAGCTCNVQGNCSATGSLSYFASMDCSGTAGLTYPVNTCITTGGSNVGFASHRYDPDRPSNVSCKSTGASTPSAASYADPTTVCCR